MFRCLQSLLPGRKKARGGLDVKRAIHLQAIDSIWEFPRIRGTFLGSL